MEFPKTALVTGATSGIGAAIVERLAADGWAIVFSGLGDLNVFAEEADALSEANDVPVAFIPADLSLQSDVLALAAHAEAYLGGVGLLVNNAGVLNTPAQAVDEVDPARWELSMAVNVTAPFLLIRALLPGMRAQGAGRIVNIASTCGLVALPNSAPYTASKHACVGLTKSVALDLAETRITCNAICPGLVGTLFVKDRIAKAARRRGEPVEAATQRTLQGRQPSGRLVEPAEVAGLVSFLAGPDGGSFNGAALPVDQAWTAM